jgi:uncharacterized protein (DUF2267 family)
MAQDIEKLIAALQKADAAGDTQAAQAIAAAIKQQQGGAAPARTHDGLPAVRNADGSHSTELSITVTDPRLNGGRPTNIPSLWGGEVVPDHDAVTRALESGNQYQSFGSIDEAVTAAKARSSAGGAGAREAGRGIGDYLLRQAGLTGRAALEGAHDVVSPFTNAAGWVMNQPLKLAGASYRFPEQSQNFSNLLSEAGLPEPETGGERKGNFGGRLLTGMATGAPINKLVTSRLGFPTTVPTTAPTKAPTIEQLKSQASAAYKAAEDAGVVISKSSFASLADEITQAANKAGFDADLHPRVAAALKRLATDSADDISFEQAEILRRVMKNASASLQPDERRIAQGIVEHFDDYIGRLGAADVISGNAQRASTSITAARDFYTRLRKAETIEEMLDKARTNAPNFSASGLENTIRIQFKQLANNSRRMRMFTQAEQEMIKKVARGGTMANALRWMGKLAPTGVISGGISGGAGYAVAGPAGAVALPAIGLAARTGASALTQRNANLAGQMMRGAPMVTGPALREGGSLLYGLPSAAGSLTQEQQRRRRLLDALKEDDEERPSVD